jgi:hypothetical protein
MSGKAESCITCNEKGRHCSKCLAKMTKRHSTLSQSIFIPLLDWWLCTWLMHLYDAWHIKWKYSYLHALNSTNSELNSWKEKWGWELPQNGRTRKIHHIVTPIPGFELEPPFHFENHWFDIPCFYVCSQCHRATRSRLASTWWPTARTTETGAPSATSRAISATRSSAHVPPRAKA